MFDPAAAYTADKPSHDARMKRLREMLRRKRILDLEIGALLSDIEDQLDFFLEGCSGIEQLGELNGLSAAETRQLVAAASAPPPVRLLLERRSISIAAAQQLQRLYRDRETYIRETDRWEDDAERLSAAELKRKIDRRIEECRVQGEVVDRTIFATARVWRHFGRARDLVSRREGKVATEGQALSEVVEYYLDGNDLLRRKPSPEPPPESAGDPPDRPHGQNRQGRQDRQDRHVRLSEQVAVAQRNGDRCPVSYCDNRIFLQNAHVQPFRFGGDQSRRNLFRPCTDHHFLHDSHLLGMTGPPESPSFFRWDGLALDRRHDPDCAQPTTAEERRIGEEWVRSVRVKYLLGRFEERAPPPLPPGESPVTVTQRRRLRRGARRRRLASLEGWFTRWKVRSGYDESEYEDETSEIPFDSWLVPLGGVRSPEPWPRAS